MAIRYFNMPSGLDYTIDISNYIFAGIFNIECLMKLIGLGKDYFCSKWNFFDFLVVIATNIGILTKFIAV